MAVVGNSTAKMGVNGEKTCTGKMEAISPGKLLGD
jgi:hypothetical protein